MLKNVYVELLMGDYFLFSFPPSSVCSYVGTASVRVTEVFSARATFLSQHVTPYATQRPCSAYAALGLLAPLRLIISACNVVLAA